MDYTQLKELMPGSTYFYGLLATEQVVNLAVTHYATPSGGSWYVGTSEPVESLASIEVPMPVVL